MRKICWHGVQDSASFKRMAATPNDHKVSINGLN